MSFFEFPHTRTYDSDLGWLIKHVGLNTDNIEALQAWYATHKAEYDDLKNKVDGLINNLVDVIVPWDSSIAYRIFSIVEYQGTNYIAVQDVPVGAMITDTNYWQPANTVIQQINAISLLVSEINDLTKETAATTYRQFKPMLTADWYIRTTSLSEADDILECYKKLGMDKVSINIPLLTSAATPDCNVNDLPQIIQKAKDAGFTVDLIKFHAGTGQSDLTDATEQANYRNSVLNVLNVVGTEVQKVIVLNERRDLFIYYSQSNGNFMSGLITAIKNLGYDVGFCTQDALYFKQMESLYSAENIIGNLDILAFDAYPPVSCYNDKATFEQSVIGWKDWITEINDFARRYPAKNVMISECGCLPFWEKLQYPSSRWREGENLPVYPALTYGGEEVVEIALYGLLSNLDTNGIDEVGFWYLEFPYRYSSYMPDFSYEKLGRFFKRFTKEVEV